MLTAEWVRSVVEQRTRLTPATCGIAYTHTFNRDPNEIWYDRLSTDVPSYIAAGLRELGIDCVYLNVEQLLETALNIDRAKKLLAVFNVCLGHYSIDNWSLIPSACSWAKIAVLPSGAHAATIGEDKKASKLFATRVGFRTAEDWAASAGDPEWYVRKPRTYGSSFGLQVLPSRDLSSKQTGPDELLEPFVPGSDLTVTLLHNPARAALDVIGGLSVRHIGDTPHELVWSENKKSQGDLNKQLDRRFHAIGSRFERKLLDLCAEIGGIKACRVDFRLLNPAESGAEVDDDSVVFLEINPCPTPSQASSFGRTVEHFLERCGSKIDFGTPAAFALASMLLSINPK